MDKPDALQLADELERDKWHVPAVVMQAAADELRRQHGEIKSMQAERLRSERRLSAVEAQRDALLEALQDLCDTLGECGMTERARAAIKKVQEGD